MKLIIAGSRDIEIEQQLLRNFVKNIKKEVAEIVSGGARGVDSCAIEFARIESLKLTIFYPKWGTYGKIAGIMRNKEMAKYADELLAIWDGKSKGTTNMIEEMKKLGKPTHVFKFISDGISEVLS